MWLLDSSGLLCQGMAAACETRWSAGMQASHARRGECGAPPSHMALMPTMAALKHSAQSAGRVQRLLTTLTTATDQQSSSVLLAMASQPGPAAAPRATQPLGQGEEVRGHGWAGCRGPRPVGCRTAAAATAAHPAASPPLHPTHAGRRRGVLPPPPAARRRHPARAARPSSARLCDQRTAPECSR